MGKYIVRRSLVAIPTIIGATLLVFLVMRVLPGDVALMIMIGPDGEGAVATSASLDRIRAELGLDRPLYMQYLTWIGSAAIGDLGNSLYTSSEIFPELARRMLVTLQLALMAEGIAILLGIPLGIITAVKQDSFLDYFLRFWSITWLAIPSFWFGILVIILGLRWFAWIPPIGWNPFYEDPIASLTQLIWPALILGGHEMARVGRMTRSTVLEVLRQDYIRTARAKGLAELLVMARHAMKNAMIPVITYTSIYFGSLLGGTVVLETVFNIPGIGHWFIQAIRVRDYTVIQSLILLFTGTFVIINLLVDLMYAWLDPRIRYC